MIDRQVSVFSANAIVEQIGIALCRIRAGRPAKNFLLIGSNGEEKGIALCELGINASYDGHITMSIAVSKHCALPKMLIEPIRTALLQLGRMDAAGTQTKRCRRVLGSFITTIADRDDVDYSDFGLELGVADNGNLDSDLCDLLMAVGEACRECGTAAVLFVDDLHLVADKHLSALLGSFHRCAQRACPFLLVGIGLPQLTGQVARAKPYSERMFEYYWLNQHPKIRT